MFGHLLACFNAVHSSFFVFKNNFVPFYVERLIKFPECYQQLFFPFFSALCLSVDLSIGVSVCTDLGQLEIWAGVEVVSRLREPYRIGLLRGQQSDERADSASEGGKSHVQVGFFFIFD